MDKLIQFQRVDFPIADSLIKSLTLPKDIGTVCFLFISFLVVYKL